MDFTSRPEVFASYEMDNHCEPDFVSDDAEPGDTFILATDALAKWILEHEELDRCEKAIGQFKQLQTVNQFQEFVDCARTNEDIPLVNDDVTLMIISVELAEHVETEEDQPVDSTYLGIGFARRAAWVCCWGSNQFADLPAYKRLDAYLQ